MQAFLRSTLVQSATLFGLGKRLPAPGTWGSLAALPMAFLLLQAGPLWMMGFCFVFVPLAVLAAEAYEQTQSGHDHSEIIIDEVVGMLIAVVWLPLTWQTFVIGFALFRFFDILKPWPISVVDRKIPGGVGVVADDLVAGVFTNILLQVMYQKTSWLGVTLWVG